MSEARPRWVLISLLAVAALGLVACSGSPSPDRTQTQTPRPTAPITLSYAQEQEFNSYNNNTEGSASVANAVVLNQVLRGFWYPGPDGGIEPDTEFGSFERVTSNPLTVKYTFNPKARWSDGVPLDCSDAVLAWAANSGRWPTGKTDPDTGQKLTAFSAARPGAWANVQAPTCAKGDTSFTLTYTTLYADWRSLFGPGTILPAHIVEKESGVPDILAAVRANNPKTMIKIGDIYNSLWVFKAGQIKPDLSPSAGPYQIAAWTAGQSITLKANPRWWGTPPRAATIVIRYIPADQQVAALRTGTVQVIDPTPTPELLAQLGGSGSPVKVSMHDSFTFEHLDFNFRTAFKSLPLRRAFAKCIPRQQIVDNLIRPQNSHAAILQSRFLLPFQPGYDTFTDLGGQQYDAVDVAGAKKILKAAGKVGMTVRIGYQAPNPRRKAEVDLIRDFCGQAGFKVVDAGTNAFFGGALERGDYDVSLFAWTGSPLVTQTYATYVTNGAQNKGGFSDPQVDLLLRQLSSQLDPQQQLALMARIDSALWRDLATVPLFTFPALLATAPDVIGVQYNPSSADVTYNLQNWSRTQP